MKNILKIGITSLACLMLFIPMVKVNAVVYDPALDYDSNGVVDVTDLTILSLYLEGDIYVYDPSIFDVNGNNIISQADRAAIQYMPILL